MKKVITIVILLAATIVVFAGCGATDVVANYSPGSFKAITAAYPQIVKDNTLQDHYYYVSVDNDTKLLVSHDYSMTGAEDVVMETPIKPFLDAGLDPAKLQAGDRADDKTLYLTADFGSGTGKKDNVVDSLFESVKFDRTVLTYHQDLDHYGIKVNGGKFEFAKDYKTNDKDIVFVILAKPLADIGVDVKNVKGWAFMTIKDTDGSNVDILAKPYNLNA